MDAPLLPAFVLAEAASREHIVRRWYNYLF